MDVMNVAVSTNLHVLVLLSLDTAAVNLRLLYSIYQSMPVFLRIS